nr:RNA-directed DNA polymerase, eukaryota, reverse transcriptase zinc-binding domain protein [Tanacetum cinerariifolium]
MQEALGTRLDMSTAYHPQTDGQSESTIQTLKDTLKARVLDFRRSWDIHFPLVGFLYNNSYHSSVRCASFEALYGRKCHGQTERTIQTLEDMLRSCALEWTGNWDDYICLVEFAYNNSWHASIKCAPFEMLYGRKCRALICWDQVRERVIEGPEMIEDQVGERVIEGPEMIEVTNEKVTVANEKLKEAHTRQKSYADKHHRSLEFQPCDRVFLKVSPARGVRHFGIKGKLSPRFIGPFKILDQSKYGIDDVKVNVNGNCFFKFRTEEGMNEILKQSPWIVNNRHLFLQKWDPVVGMEKSTIPLWAKLTNVPLEAWSKEGINALASNLGKPIIMDNMISEMFYYNRQGGFKKVNGNKRYQGNGKMNKEKGKAWILQNEVLSAMKTSANKYVVLREMNVEEKNKLNMLKDRIIVDHGDFNVTLNPGEHSAGSSNITNDMQDLIDCVNNIKVKDIASSGLFYTWIKSPLKASASIMKKLDRIMLNGGFMVKFETVAGQFMPFLTSDHSAAILTVLESIPKRSKAFRFVNYIADKPEFIYVVEEGWKNNIMGCHMFRVVKKLKALKKPMSKLNWKNGNLFEKVEKLRGELKQAHISMEKKPNCSLLKAIEAECLMRYLEAVADEKKLLFQKAKIKWLQNGDRNSRFFHKVIQSKKSCSRITCICNEEGIRCIVGDDVCAAIKDFFSNEKLLREGYNCKNEAKRCALKVDITKAYETVDWSFLESRLQLIAYVLAVIETYWASVVMLPKATVKEINMVLKSFLWNNGQDVKDKAKIAWSVVCSPKIEGGLGLKKLIKHIWKLKYLLDLRRKVRQCIIHEIRNGKGTSMWYDNWHDIGPLSNFIDNRCLYDARLENDCKLADMIDGSRWKWPQECVNILQRYGMVEKGK